MQIYAEAAFHILKVAPQQISANEREKTTRFFVCYKMWLQSTLSFAKSVLFSRNLITGRFSSTEIINRYHEIQEKRTFSASEEVAETERRKVVVDVGPD